MTSAEPQPDRLALADWRRQVGDLYARVRAQATVDPARAWETWRTGREALYLEHTQSPVPPAARAEYRGRYWAYDPAMRFEVMVVSGQDADAGAKVRVIGSLAGAGSTLAPTLALPMSSGDELAFSRIATVVIPFPAGPRSLSLFWMAGYAGGLFLPFRDSTNGSTTYGAGRYLLDTAKGADLGGDVGSGRLILDFNFAFHPSCAFDPKWSCPLAPPDNRLDIAIEAGERLYVTDPSPRRTKRDSGAAAGETNRAVRTAVVADAGAIARVRTASWRAAYTGIVPDAILERLDAEALKARFEERIADPGPISTLVVEDRERRVVGFASVGPARDDDVPGLGEVYAIYLDPAFRGLGFGRSLLAAAMARLFGAGFGEIVLWVLTDNHPARRFYGRHGFALEGQVRILDFDGQPIEEVRYRRSIST